jgi:hypothetical protein
MKLSAPDIQHVWTGLGVMVGVLLVANFVALFFGGLSTAWFAGWTRYTSLFYATMVFTLTMNVALFGVLKAWRTVRGLKPVASGVAGSLAHATKSILKRR